MLTRMTLPAPATLADFKQLHDDHDDLDNPLLLAQAQMALIIRNLIVGLGCCDSCIAKADEKLAPYLS